MTQYSPLKIRHIELMLGCSVYDYAPKKKFVEYIGFCMNPFFQKIIARLPTTLN